MEAAHAEANAVLRVVEQADLGYRHAAQDSWLLVVADLAECHRPRETARAAHLLREAAERRPEPATPRRP